MARPWNIEGLRRTDSVQTGYARILRTRTAEMLYHGQKVVGNPGDPEAVHDLRVSARRLQAALALSPSLFGKKRLERFRNLVQNLVRALGRVRETDVMILTLATHRTGLAARQRTGLDLLAAQLRNTRRDQATVLLERFRRLTEGRFQVRLNGVLGSRRRGDS